MGVCPLGGVTVLTEPFWGERVPVQTQWVQYTIGVVHSGPHVTGAVGNSSGVQSVWLSMGYAQLVSPMQ